ncbi:MAG: potassium channel family protein [Erythrobacter sp.]|nr:potassium channel family protein [Erythrobacter sp.]
MTSIALAALLIAATIFIHYETLRLVSLGATDLNVRPRMRMWMMLSGALVSHLLHIALYAGAYILLEKSFGLGEIAGPDSGEFNDAFYFSITSYTTLGIGDIYPTGQVRLLSGIEALNGLVMVTWTASMTYLHMERYWHIDDAD